MRLIVARDRYPRRRVRPDARQRSAHRVEQLEDRLLLTAIAWNSPVDGDWNVAGNWLPPQVPGSGDDVTIDLAGFNPTVTISDPRTVNSIVSRESLVVAGTGAFTVNAASQIDASTLPGSGYGIHC